MQDLTTELLRAIGTPTDRDEAFESYRFSAAGTVFVLRRDCFGAMRRLEIAFADQSAADVARQKLDSLGSWQIILPAQLEILDRDGLGRLTWTGSRLHALFRLAPQQEQLHALLTTLIDGITNT